MAKMAVEKLQAKITEYLTRARNEKKILTFTDDYGYIFTFYEGVGGVSYCIVKNANDQGIGEAMVKSDWSLQEYSAGGQALLAEILKAYQSEPVTEQEKYRDKLSSVYLTAQAMTGQLAELVRMTK